MGFSGIMRKLINQWVAVQIFSELASQISLPGVSTSSARSDITAQTLPQLVFCPSVISIRLFLVVIISGIFCWLMMTEFGCWSKDVCLSGPAE